MKTIVTLRTNRYAYDINEAAARSITVGELINLLKDEDEDAKVVFSNDNGYTYGYIDSDTIESGRYESTEERELREDMEALQDELNVLEDDYERVPEDDDDEAMTEEEYQSDRDFLFTSYGITEEQYNEYFSK